MLYNWPEVTKSIDEQDQDAEIARRKSGDFSGFSKKSDAQLNYQIPLDQEYKNEIEKNRQEPKRVPQSYISQAPENETLNDRLSAQIMSGGTLLSPQQEQMAQGLGMGMSGGVNIIGIGGKALNIAEFMSPRVLKNMLPEDIVRMVQNRAGRPLTKPESDHILNEVKKQKVLALQGLVK